MPVLPEFRQQRILSWIEKKLGSIHWPTIAKRATELSTHFQSPQPTPWGDPLTMAAYLSYFYPLNYARCWNVIAEANRSGVLAKIESINDFGCGPGVMLHCVEDFFESTPGDNFSKGPLFFFEEIDPHASQVALDLHTKAVKFDGVIRKHSLLASSFAITELTTIPSHWWDFDSLMIIAPATHHGSHLLIQLRSSLIQKGYQILAPCTHQEQCPLFEHPRDWCHMRTNFAGPIWWPEIEAHIPMQNTSLTYSYLVASMTCEAAQKGTARVIGDTQIEKGRSRLLVCGGHRRNELYWLHRKIDKNFSIPRGSLIRYQTDWHSQERILINSLAELTR